MFLKYDTENSILYNDLGKIEEDITIDIGNFQRASISVSKKELQVRIPAFTLVNIYYCREKSWVTITTDLQRLVNKDLRTPDSEYIPLSSTPYDGVEIFCSFLRYIFYKDTIELSPIDIMSENGGLHSNFLNECGRLSNLMLGKQTVIPLSGGMDSRVLAFLFRNNTPVSYTHGERNCGDIILARKVARYLELENLEFNIENLSHEDLNMNITLSDNFLSGERLLYMPSDEFCEKEHFVLSGLYGDVVFGKAKLIDFTNYAENELKRYSLTKIDKRILECYSTFITLDTHAKLLLRCQKLTRMSLVMNSRGYPIAPWVTNEVISALSSRNINDTYENFVKLTLPRNLRTIIHQSSQSVFTHPKFVRFVTKVVFRVFKFPIAKPYFSNKTLKRLNL